MLPAATAPWVHKIMPGLRTPRIGEGGPLTIVLQTTERKTPPFPALETASIAVLFTASALGQHQYPDAGTLLQTAFSHA